MKNITLFLVAIMALAWTSCTETDDPSSEKNKTDLLTAHAWKLTAVTIDPAYQGATDIFANVPCYQDNAENYMGNGTFLQNEGNNVCSPYAKTNTGTWSFNSTETILQTVYDDEDIPNSSYNIETLSENTLKYSGVYTIEGEDHTITYTFAAQ